MDSQASYPFYNIFGRFFRSLRRTPRLLQSDSIDFLFYGQGVQDRHRNAEKQADPAVEDYEGVAKCALELFKAASCCARIGDTPAGGHRLTWPNRTDLARRAIADRKYKVHPGRTRFRKFLP